MRGNGYEEQTTRPRQGHEVLARILWFPHTSWGLPNGCAIYPSHYRSSCYLRMCKDCVRNHLKRWVLSTREGLKSNPKCFNAISTSDHRVRVRVHAKLPIDLCTCLHQRLCASSYKSHTDSCTSASLRQSFIAFLPLSPAACVAQVSVLVNPPNHH